MAIAIGCWGGFAAMLVWHDRLPWPLVLLGFALLGGWYMSLQHEVLHGHPTPWGWLNDALVMTPLSLWLPYALYRDTHLDHHEVELTAPGVDPETFYVGVAEWEHAGPIRRRLLVINRTMLGRLLIGPALGPQALVRSELARMRREPATRRMWLGHAVGVVVVCWVVFGVADVPVWQYLLGYCYFGMSVGYVRSFVEHLAVPAPASRSAVVRSGWFFGILFLFNNLHHTHHALPGAAWYRLPRLTDEMGADDIAAQGAGLYRGYWEVARRYGIRPFSTPVTPLADSVTLS